MIFLFLSFSKVLLINKDEKNKIFLIIFEKRLISLGHGLIIKKIYKLGRT